MHQASNDLVRGSITAREAHAGLLLQVWALKSSIPAEVCSCGTWQEGQHPQAKVRHTRVDLPALGQAGVILHWWPLKWLFFTWEILILYPSAQSQSLLIDTLPENMDLKLISVAVTCSFHTDRQKLKVFQRIPLCWGAKNTQRAMPGALEEAANISAILCVPASIISTTGNAGEPNPI